MKIKALFISLVGSLMFASSAFASIITVSPDNPNGWGWGAETGTGTVSFITGPGTPPAGSGSVQLALDSDLSGLVIGTGLYAGTRLDNISTLMYSTYNTVGNNTVAPSLQFNIDYDLTDASASWQGRLVYEPYYDNAIVDGVWQTWNALAGRWWMTGNPIWGDVEAPRSCPISSPCFIADILALFPDAGIQVGALGGLLFKSGSGWDAGTTSSVDNFMIGLSRSSRDSRLESPVTTFDFEPAAVPTPATIGMFLLGLALIAIRRRHVS